MKFFCFFFNGQGTVWKKANNREKVTNFVGWWLQSPIPQIFLYLTKNHPIFQSSTKISPFFPKISVGFVIKNEHQLFLSPFWHALISFERFLLLFEMYLDDFLLILKIFRPERSEWNFLRRLNFSSALFPEKVSN